MLSIVSTTDYQVVVIIAILIANNYSLLAVILEYIDCKAQKVFHSLALLLSPWSSAASCSNRDYSACCCNLCFSNKASHITT